MSEKTKKINPWLYVILLTVILLFATSSIDLSYSTDDWLLKILASLFVPAAELANTSSEAALEHILSGNEFPSAMVNISILFSMAGMLMLLFLVPWMLVTGSNNDPETGEPVKSKRWFVATPVIITATIIAVGIGIITTFYYIHDKEEFTKGYERSMMQQQAVDLALNAASVVFIPHEAGGGDGLFTNFPGKENGEVRNIRLDDLDRFDPESHFPTEIDAVADSAIVITVQNHKGDKKRTGDVTPYGDKLFQSVFRIVPVE